jgi:FSR family fosmidomycin resistance protein-like MFS transporter
MFSLKTSAVPPQRRLARFVFLLLTIEFLDELVFGAREAAWPLIRNDLALTYAQVGLLLSVPNIVSALIEPALGVLGDVWKRRALILGGGLVFALALVLHSLAPQFGVMLVALTLM